MKLKTEKYNTQIKQWPQKGKHIMAQYDEIKIIVYQSYRPEIGLFATKNQYFGGDFKLSRMTWIKPNFLWMMYRNGWGQKEGQEIILAIHLKLDAFMKYLNQAVVSVFDSELHTDHESWQNAVKSSNVRLQWDPDHDPYGQKLERKAIQIGLRNELIKSYAKDDIIEIEDISSFVEAQYKHVQSKNLDQLETPLEKPLLIQDEKLIRKLQMT